ncbi:MAG: hypothetical protein QOJ16_3227 [Acidobacteriota bacterium]|nr:hypothetical protein [Acidobacteriota bacterium]
MRAFRFPWRSAREIRADVDEELQFHLDLRAGDLIARGLPPDAARARALAEFGDLEEARRSLRTLDLETEAVKRRRDYMGDLKQDLSVALRIFRSSPVFAATAILTLALGVGANTAIFSVVNGVLLRPLPFPHPEELFFAWSANRTAGNFESLVSPVDLDDWRAQRRRLTDLGGYWYKEGGSGIDLTGMGEPRRLSAVFVTPGFFTTLGIQASAGRLPREDEMVRGGRDRVAVLTHGFWQRQLGGSRAAIGSRLTLGGAPYEVLGVLPPGLGFPSEQAEVFIPYSTIPDDAIPRLRDVRILSVIARGRPGVTAAEAKAELDTIARRLAAQYPQDAAWDSATVRPLHETITGPVRRGLLVLFGAAAFILLLACVNVASLLLARATVRGREIAVRAALGAGRGRIVRQLLTESLLLALLGGAAGLGVAAGGVRLLLALAAGQLPRGSEVRLDGPVLAFALGVTVVAGLLFGLVPALRASSSSLEGTLREGGRGMVGTDAQRFRSGLVIAEVALAVMLVVGAGLMTRSFVRLLRVDTGFRPDHLLVMNFSINVDLHPKYTLYYQQVLEAVRKVPGVITAGAIKDAPFQGEGERYGFLPPGLAVPPGEEPPTAPLLHVSDGYFQAIGARMVEGREFTPGDNATSPVVLVVNEAFARRWFPGERAVGKELIIWGKTRVPIVGVVHDIRQSAVEKPAEPSMYIANQQNGRARVMLVVRTAGEPLALAPAVREAIWSLDRSQPITSISTFDDIVSGAMARPRLLTSLLGAFAGLGLLLSALGLYGVLSYLVNQRQREIGVRLALGANPVGVLRSVVGRGLGLTAIGLAVGLAGAFALGRSLSGVLYGVEPTDPATFAGVTVILLGVAALASWLPARRAAEVNPAVMLRAE